MKVEEIISSNYGQATRFTCYLEARNYMYILGAKINDENKKFVLDGKICSFWGEYHGIFFEEGVPPQVEEELDKCGTHYFGNTIFDLESLLLMHEMLRNRDPKETLEDTVFQTKKQMLLLLIGKKGTFTHREGRLSDFDEGMIPFLRDDFDIDKFARECIFNTTGYYENEGEDALKFSWKRKQTPSIEHFYERTGDRYWSMISEDERYNRRRS